MFSRLPVLRGYHRRKLMRLVTMRGITPKQQEWLYDEVCHIGNDEDLARIRRYCEALETQGAEFIYDDNGKPRL